MRGWKDVITVLMVIRKLAPRREKKPLRFDATGQWKDFHLHFDMFEACKLYNMWTDEEAALQLFTSVVKVKLCQF